MDDKNSLKQEGKPFSVLEKFRQLKKEKEQGPLTAEESATAQETSGNTVFQASGSPSSSSNGDFGRGGFRGRGFGRFGGRRGKRSYNDNTAERPAKRSAADIGRGQKETDVGITEFIRSGPGFDVILKHRYTDFHVHEIDVDGNVTKLASTEVPKESEVSDSPSKEENPNILSPEKWEALKDIVEKKLPSTVEKDVTDLSKDERQRVHKAVKLRFGVHVYSNTNNVDGRKIMKIGYGSNQNYRSPRWPDGRPEYLHFVLHKENCETSEAIQVMSRHIKTKPNKFSYAGTKDKRAVTTQQMCLRRIEASRFKGCNEWRAITVGNFCYKWNNLRLGDLSGNRFKLALRNVKASEEVIEEAVESLKNKGFINYFGMQRFGQSALVPTHLVGQAILKGDWKLATELILKPRPGESTYWDLKEAREVWWEKRDAAEALKCLARKEKSIEGKILTALKKLGPNCYQNAFDSLPHHTVTLYLHSYQSLVWNKVVSRRVREFGLKVLPGDLICGSRDLDQLAYLQENKAESDTSEDDDDEDGGCKIQVRVVSAEEAETASIYDVVYPLPGDDIRYPDNEIARWYREILEADGHATDSFGKLNRKYGMYGTYRKMLETVGDLNWYIQRYSEPDEDLLLSDLDVLKGKPPLVSDPDGPYKAIIVEFNLKTCCYATMAVRELSKCETSVVSQSMLTNQAREEDLASKKLKTEMMELESEVKSEQIPGSADNNCASSSNNEVQGGKSLGIKETESMKMVAEKSPNKVAVVGETSDVKMEVDSDNNVDCDSTQGNRLSENKIEIEPSNILDKQQSNGNLDGKDSIHLRKEQQLDESIEHIET